jgi:hypothetical protein
MKEEALQQKKPLHKSHTLACTGIRRNGGECME